MRSYRSTAIGVQCIWCPWTSACKDETNAHLLFSFLTTDPNDLVRTIHAKGMSVIPQDGEEQELWLSGQPPDSLTLQLRLPSEMFTVVLSGCKLDDGGITAQSGWINVQDLAA